MHFNWFYTSLPKLAQIGLVYREAVIETIAGRQAKRAESRAPLILFKVTYNYNYSYNKCS